jgi:bacterioferritin-associated ferredoxin
MIVCVCHRVSDRDIARHAAAGCPSFEVMQDDLRVATACGACHDCAREVWDAHACPSGLRMAAAGAPAHRIVELVPA